MTRTSVRFAAYFLTAAVIATVSAQTQPTIILPTSASAPNGIAPNGIGATTTELLFSQPFGTAAPQPRGIYSATNFTPNGAVLNATVAETIALPTTRNAENYFVIAQGFGGFTAGTVFSTNPSSATTDAVFRNGALFINGIPDSNPGHAGITFDGVGTFGNALIVTTPSGIFGFNSAGALLFAYPAPANFFLESATVAPLTNSACPGCLYLTSESSAAVGGGPGPFPNGNIYVIKPNTPSGTAPTFVATAPGVEPESILFVTPQVCTLSATNFAYFVSAYAAGPQIFSSTPTNGALLGYTQSQISALSGRALIPFEGSPAVAGSIVAFNPSTNGFTAFSTPTPIPATTPAAYQLEGASLVACPPATGCPATQGFWKHHSFPASMFTNGTVVIAGVSYTASQLVDILNTPPAGGNAALILMHQLIAALANEAAGAQNVGVVEDGVNVNLAIAEALSLLQFGLPQPGFPGTNPANVQFPINFNASTGNFVPADSTLGGYLTTLSNILDAYNSAVGLNCEEASGLGM
jgi:hypothetical protein